MFLAVGCELNSPHLMHVKRHFVSCLDLIQHRQQHLQRRTCLATIRTTANQWTSQPHCSRQCCLTRKVYSMGREGMGCHCYISSIYYTVFGSLSVFCSSLCCSLPVCCRCMRVSLSVLLLPFKLFRPSAVVHAIRLVLWHLHTYESGAIKSA